MGKQEQAALEAVAGHLGVPWEAGGGAAPDAWLSVGGKCIAVSVAAIRPGAAGADAGIPRLRFDKVVLRLVADLQAALRPAVPAGKAVVVTVTAPIRLASKTGGAIAGMVMDGLALRPQRVEVAETVNGNRVRARLVPGVSGAERMIGFVHNPDTDGDILIDAAAALLGAVDAAAKHRPPEPGGERWLVIANGDGLAHPATWRQVWSALAVPPVFARVLMVLPGGAVADLSP